MACVGLIDADILFDCADASVAGLETDIVIINQKDLDLDATTIDGTNKLLMTNLQLKAGKTGFLLEGVKQVNSVAHELVKKDTGPDKKKHIFNGFILTPSVANKLQLEQMSEGEKYVVVVNKKWKGTANADAFEIYGFNSGLELNVSTFNSNENDGAILFELSSADGFEEPKYPLTLLETNHATTLTAFTAKFVQV